MQLEIDPAATADAELLTNRSSRITLCDDPYAMQGGLDMNLRKDYLRNHDEIRAIMAQANPNRPAHEPFAHVTVNRRQAKEDTADIQVTLDMNICMTIVSLRGHIQIHTREPKRTIADIKAGETWTLPTAKERSWGERILINADSENAVWIELRTGRGMRCKDCRKGELCEFQVCGFSNHENKP
jgi:hypothetical protein